MPITGNVKLLQPGTLLTPAEQRVYATARDINAVASAAELEPNHEGSAILTALVQFANRLLPGQRDMLPLALRNVARALEDQWATRQ